MAFTSSSLRYQTKIGGIRCHFYLRPLETHSGHEILTILPVIPHAREPRIPSQDHVSSNPLCDAALPALWDLRWFDFEATDIIPFHDLCALIMRFAHQNTDIKFAFLVADETGLEVMRMFRENAGQLAIERPDRLMVSRNETALVRWLTQ